MQRRRFGKIVATTLLSIETQLIGAQEKRMPNIRFVVFHRPGPNWNKSLPAFEQQGLQGHLDHFKEFLKLGKLAMGGPFMDSASGGMMIPEESVSEDEMRKFADEDPTVRSGLLVYELRRWMPALKR